MAKRKKRTPEEDGEGGEKKGKKKLLLAVLLVVALLGAGYVELHMKHKTALSTSPGPTTTTTLAGPVMVLPALTLNLAGGHYLQVTPALQLAPTEKTKAMSAYQPRLVNTCIATLSGQAMGVLSGPGGIHQAQASLTQAIDGIYPGTVTGVYFTQWVMQ